MSGDLAGLTGYGPCTCLAWFYPAGHGGKWGATSVQLSSPWRSWGKASREAPFCFAFPCGSEVGGGKPGRCLSFNFVLDLGLIKP